MHVLVCREIGAVSLLGVHADRDGAVRALAEDAARVEGHPTADRIIELMDAQGSNELQIEHIRWIIHEMEIGQTADIHI